MFFSHTQVYYATFYCRRNHVNYVKKVFFLIHFVLENMKNTLLKCTSMKQLKTTINAVHEGKQLKRKIAYKVDTLKVAFFREYDAFFSLPKKCAKNYPEKEILKLRSVQSQLTLTALQCQMAEKFKIQSLGQNTAHFLGNGNNTNIFPRILDLQQESKIT